MMAGLDSTIRQLSSAGSVTIKYSIYTIVVCALVIALYFGYMHLTKKKYRAIIYLPRTDGTYKPVTSVVVRQNFDKFTHNYMWFVKRPDGGKMTNIIEPNDECIERIGKMDRIILIKKGNNYVPAKPRIEGEKIVYEPMSYDLDTFRINESLRRMEKYKSENKWVQLAPLIISAMLIVGIIVIGYMSYQHIQKQSGTMASQAKEMTADLKDIARAIATISENNAQLTRGVSVPVKPDEPIY